MNKGLRIKREIDALNREHKAKFNHRAAAVFILDEDAVAYFEKIQELQDKCPHEIKNGKCIYCYIEEDLGKDE